MSDGPKSRNLGQHSHDDSGECLYCQAQSELAPARGSATNVYDPVQCLREEVERFKATNKFSPMLVTNFYAQAACVLTELERAREENKRLTGRIKSLEKQVDNLETELVELTT